MEQTESNLLVNLLDYVGQRKIIQDQAKELSHHIKMSKDSWSFTSYHAGSITFNPSQIVEENEKLIAENLNDLVNGLNTTIRPKKFESLNNVILLQGIKESIDRDIGVASTELNWNSLGSSSTAEAESQTDLQSEFTDTAYARKVFSTAGSRSRVNQTMKLVILCIATSLEATPRIKKEPRHN